MMFLKKRTNHILAHSVSAVFVLCISGMTVCSCMPMPDRYVYDTQSERALFVGTEAEAGDSHAVGVDTEQAQAETLPVTVPDSGVWAADRSRSKGFTYRIKDDGTCAIIGMGHNADARLMLPSYTDEGRLINTIGDQAFYGCGTTKTVYIPSSMTDIGELCFTGCLHLSWFSVEPDNPAYTAVDGVLFSRDMSVLICYPAGRVAKSYTIPASVTRIEPMAFFACDSLRYICYEGSMADWESVSVGEGNDFLSDKSGLSFLGGTERAD